MRTKEFLSRLDHQRIVAAIASAEAKTSGEMRVFIRRGKIEAEPLAAAQQEFARLGLARTRERNAILIFVAPRARKFAIVGDAGIHQKCGPAFWENLVATMRAHFVREEFTDALVEAIASAGQLLERHFPRRPDDRDELSNDVIEG